MGNDTQLSGLSCSQDFAAQEKWQGSRCTNESYKADCAAKTWMNPQFDLGQADLGCRLICGNTIIAGKGQFQPSAKTKAVDQAHGGEGEVFNHGKNILPLPYKLQCLFLGGYGGEAVNICSGNEPIYLTRLNK